MPSFSICIPNYNYARYIGETIQSVLNQTYTDFEIVVVDNASTDNSVEVVKSFNDPRIKLFVNQYNVGFAPNLDRAAQKASDPFIIMLSSDDLMRPTALEEYARIIEHIGSEAAENALLVSSIDVIDGEGRIRGRMDRTTYYDIPPDNVFHIPDSAVETFSGHRVFKVVFPKMSVPGHFCTTLYSRALYERVGGYSSMNLIGPDAHFAYKALLENVHVIFINRPLFAYRVHAANQLAQQKHNLTIKVPIDRYLFSIQYAEKELAKAGVERVEMSRFLIDDTVLKGGLIELANGSWYQAFRFFMFGWASYPGLMMRNGKMPVLTLLLILGPVGVLAARLLQRAYVSSRKPLKRLSALLLLFRLTTKVVG